MHRFAGARAASHPGHTIRTAHSSFLSHDLQQHTLPHSRGALLRERAFAAARGGWFRSLYFPVFLQIRNLPSPVSRSQAHTHTPPRSRDAFCARGWHPSFTPPESRGGRSAEKRSGAAAPVGYAITRRTRRLRGALRPIARQDARERAYDAGRSPLGAPPWRFWASGPRFRLLGRPPPYNGGQLPCGSVQRAPRSQVVVPGGRGPGPPGASGYEPPPQDATPRSAFRIVSGDAPR